MVVTASRYTCARLVKSSEWRDGRVAEGGGLLNRCTVKSRTGGSNPPLSATEVRLVPHPFHPSLIFVTTWATFPCGRRFSSNLDDWSFNPHCGGLHQIASG